MQSYPSKMKTSSLSKHHLSRCCGKLRRVIYADFVQLIFGKIIPIPCAEASDTNRTSWSKCDE